MDPKSGDAELYLMLGRMEGKLDAVLLRQEQTDKALKDHDKRIGSLERAKAWLLGASAVVGAGASYFINNFPLR